MKIVIRADSVEIDGYVNAVGRDSRRITDEYGNEFVEQIQPGVFAKALMNRSEPISMLLDHNKARVLSDTENGLELCEDSIGLHAHVVVTDPEVIEKARARQLKGWSFGFVQLDNRRTYDYDQSVVRSIVTELELKEVSIIDQEMTPVYAGTSVQARAEEKTISCRAFDDSIEYDEIKPEARAKEEPKPEIKPVIDYSKYDEVINKLRRN